MTVLFCGIGLIAAGFAVIVAREVAGGIVVGALVKQESVRPAAEHTWSIATSLMTSIATTVIVVGVFFGIAGWLASPTGSAKAARRFLAPVLRDYPAYVYSGLAIVVGIYFLQAPTQNLRSFLTTLAIAGMTAFGIHELRKQANEENPDAGYNEIYGRTKDRVVDAVKSANLGERASKLKLPEVRRPERRRRRGRGETAGPRRCRGRPAGPPRAARRPAREGRSQRRGAGRREGPPARMQTLEVSRRLAIWTIVGVCALSAAIGSSITLLAETGPPGKEGETGTRGPRGPKAPKAPWKARTSAFSNPKSKAWRGNWATSVPPKAGSKNSKKT